MTRVLMSDGCQRSGVRLPLALVATVGLLIGFAQPASAADGDRPFETVAGTGESGSTDDADSTALGSQLNRPDSLVFDTEGRLHISDLTNHRVRRVSTDGTIETIAGTGDLGSTDDPGSSAAGSQLNSPLGLAFDAEQRLHIADSQNYRVRRVNVDGTIETIAGTGVLGSVDDAGSTAAGSQINYGVSIAFDADGRLHIAEFGGDRVRRVNIDGTVETIAGTGVRGSTDDAGSTAIGSQLDRPVRVAFDAEGRLHIADYFNHRVRRVNTDGTIETIAGTGTEGSTDDAGSTAAGSQLGFPDGLAFDAEGRLHIADSRNNRVRRVNADGTIETVAGNGATDNEDAGEDGVLSGLEAAVDDPWGLAFDRAGNLYVATSASVRRLVLDQTPPVITVSPETDVEIQVLDELTVSFDCADDGRITSCAATAGGDEFPSGQQVSFDSPGVHTLTITAIDDAGNTATTVVPVSVRARSVAADEITRLFQVVLGRTPDADGLEYWTGQLQTGVGRRQIAIELLASPEAATVYGADPTDADFVDRVYRNFRPGGADVEGRAYWLGQLSAGVDRVEALLFFADADEVIRATRTAAPLDPEQARILRLYRAALGREPDDEGLAYWVDEHLRGVSLDVIADSFLASTEARNRYGNSPSDDAFVNALYRNVLNREPDDDGFTHWAAALESGVPRIEILIAFSESIENLRRTGTTP